MLEKSEIRKNKKKLKNRIKRTNKKIISYKKIVKIKEEFTTLYMYSKIQVQYDVGYTTETLPASIQEVILNYCLSINDNTHDSIFRNTSSVDNMCSQFRMRFI